MIYINIVYFVFLIYLMGKHFIIKTSHDILKYFVHINSMETKIIENDELQSCHYLKENIGK